MNIENELKATAQEIQSLSEAGVKSGPVMTALLDRMDSLEQQKNAAFASSVKSAVAGAEAKAAGKSGEAADAAYFGAMTSEIGSNAAKSLLGGGKKNLDPSGSLTMLTETDDVVQLSGRQNFVAQLLASPGGRVVNSGSIAILRQNLRNNQAAPVAAGSLKPTSIYNIEEVVAPLETVAHLSQAIDKKIMDDYASLNQFVSSELVYGLALAIDNMIVNGSGTSPELEGLLSVSGTLAQAFDTDVATTLRRSLEQMAAIGKMPNQLRVLMNASDVANLDLSQDSNQRFMNVSSVSDSGITRVWGMEVFPSTVIAAGTAIVGDFQSCRFHTREASPELIWTQHGNFTEAGVTADLFSHNKILMRAETRVVSSVTKPGDFVVASLA